MGNLKRFPSVSWFAHPCSNRLYVYTVCCRRGGQCFSVLRTRHTDVVGDSSGRSYVTEKGHNVPLLRTRGLECGPPSYYLHKIHRIDLKQGALTFRMERYTLLLAHQLHSSNGFQLQCEFCIYSQVGVHSEEMINTALSWNILCWKINLNCNDNIQTV